MKRILIAALACSVMSSAYAQRGLKHIPDPDVEKQAATFKMAEGFEVNLFAADPMFAKPIQMNWDPAGRLWVASSAIYPQIKPGQKANDTIVVLEDTTGDGKADKHTVFAEGLLIPTAVMPYKTGAFVANSTELLFLDDTDGDGKADTRQVVLSGFGSEDTHHILHTFRWGPDGNLYMHQSIYIHSHVETPYGPRRLPAGGTWVFNPETLRLEVMMQGLVNHWGHHYDEWGQSFATDGASGTGINYIFPGSVYVAAKEVLMNPLKGLNPGQPKLAGLEFLTGRHIPDAWKGHLIAHDFRGHRTAHYVLSEDGSGYASRRGKDLMSSSHRAFRPVDVKMGPDGAIYIADWYNPIIQHGEVDFRDKRRDHTHGRVWRVTAKGRDLVEKPKLVSASNKNLLEFLKVPEQWTREQAKRVLAERDGKDVIAVATAWAKALDESDAAYPQRLLEASWVLQSHGHVDSELIDLIWATGEGRAHAASIRILMTWRRDNLSADSESWFQDLLQKAVTHEHPRVRLEAIHLLREQATPDSIALGLQVLDKPTDRYLDFAVTLMLRETEGVWLKPLREGKQPFSKPAHVIRALEAGRVKDAAGIRAKLLKSPELEGEARAALLALIAEVGTANELNVVFEELPKLADPLPVLASAARASQRPQRGMDKILPLIKHESSEVRAAAMRLAGAWRVPGAGEALTAVLSGAGGDVDKRAAIESLGRLGDEAAKSALTAVLTEASNPVSLRMAALEQQVLMKGADVTGLLKAHLSGLEGADPGELTRRLLEQPQGAQKMLAAVQGAELPSAIAAGIVRSAGSMGRDYSALIQAVTKAGGLEPLPSRLSPEETSALIVEVARKGNAARGEAVYRKPALACMTCHAIGGAGGVVGPDLVSIGASAPVDYLIDSIFEPNKKIKEGYHLTTIQTKDGRVITGRVLRKSAAAVDVLDPIGQVIAIPRKDVKSETIVPTSVMPPGLTASLRRDEVVDLIRFLSELGKDGDFKVGAERFVRRFETLSNRDEAMKVLAEGGIKSLVDKQDSLRWGPAYARVDGSLSAEDGVAVEVKDVPLVVFRFKLEVTTPGEVGFKISDYKNVALSFDGKSVERKSKPVVTLTRGVHQGVVVFRPTRKVQAFSIELIDVKGSAAKAQALSGP